MWKLVYETIFSFDSYTNRTLFPFFREENKQFCVSGSFYSDLIHNLILGRWMNSAKLV